MRISLRFLLPGMIVFLTLIVGLALTISSTYLFYQREINSAIQERITDLKVIKNTFYDPMMYYRGLSFWPDIRTTFIQETAKATNVVFLRVVEPATGKILVSNLKEEIGKISTNLPPFPPEPFIRKGTWGGEEIIELSMRGVATENLWMGITLKPIKQAALKMAIIEGMGVVVALIFLSLGLYFALNKIILNPLMILYQGIQQIRKGELEVKMPAVSRNEIGELIVAFNELIKDLKESRAALEESKKVLEIRVEARTRQLQELAEGLEEEVKRRTKELQEKMIELEKFQKLAIGRELKMVELKKEIEELKRKLEKYKS
jgi:methyl-accepting chemotaxis protein